MPEPDPVDSTERHVRCLPAAATVTNRSALGGFLAVGWATDPPSGTRRAAATARRFAFRPKAHRPTPSGRSEVSGSAVARRPVIARLDQPFTVRRPRWVLLTVTKASTSSGVVVSATVVCDRLGDGRSLVQGGHRVIFRRPLAVLQGCHAMTAPSSVDPTAFLHEQCPPSPQDPLARC